jgi:hypothetical protein
MCSVCCVFTGCHLIMASNAIDPPASMLHGCGPRWLVFISQWLLHFPCLHQGWLVLVMVLFPTSNSRLKTPLDRPECHVLAKIFTISKDTTAVNMFLLKFRVTWSASLIHWSAVLWFSWKPNWLAFSKFLFLVCFWVVLKISFSNSLPVMDKRLIGHKCGRIWQNYNFYFFPRCWEVTKLKAVIE